MRIHRAWLQAIVFMAAAISARAVQLGQTMDQLVAESGIPTFEDHAKNTVQYRWDLWRMDIQFQQEKITSIAYTKADDLTEAEITQLLKARSNGKTWKPIGFQGMTSKNWMRSDYAVAVFDPKFPRSIRFSGGKYEPAPAVSSSLPSPSQIVTPLQVTPTFQPLATVRPTTSRNATVPVVTPDNAAPSIAALFVFFMSACAIVGVIAIYRKIVPADKAARSTITATTPPPFPLNNWQPPRCKEPTLDSLTWEQFEMLTGEIYRRKGWEVELCAGLGADGGVDLRFRSGDDLTLVQCKHWKAFQVGARDIREFFGVLVSEQATRGVFITSGRFSKDALQFADGKPIDMIDRAGVEFLVAEVSQPGENLYDVKKWERSFNLQANFTIPTCPFCSATMVSQTARRSGNLFWGCSNYPRCKGQRKRRTDLEHV